MRAIINRIIDDFHERPFPELLPRQQEMFRIHGKANAVIGMRRTGKTWFCFQQMLQIIERGYRKEQILYLNFEDERLLPFKTEDFQTIIETYYRKFPNFKDKQCFLFLDEIQQISGWEKFVRRVLDTEKLSVVVTGSSSKLLSSEIATSLRGRSLTTEIFPFSFNEYLQFKDITTPSSKQFGAKIRAILQNEVAQYLQSGGFPEVQVLPEFLRRDVFSNYLDVVLLRDVIERHSVSNTVAIRSLMREIMNAAGSKFSVNKFYNSLRSQGISCTKNSLYEYLEHLEDAFFVFRVPLHSRSERTRRVNPQKVYIIDTGLLETLKHRMTEDRGALLENMVYLHLRRHGIKPEYYISNEGYEVDFHFISQSNRNKYLIQVCWDLSKKQTREREIRALQAAMHETGVKKSIIVTWLDECVFDEYIEAIPLWKWLLADPILEE